MALALSPVRVAHARQLRVLVALTAPPARVTTPSLPRRVCPVLVALALSPVRVAHARQLRARQLRVLAVMAPPARVVRARRVVAALVLRAQVLPALAARVLAVTALRVLAVMALRVLVVRVRLPMAARAPLRQLLVPVVLRVPTRA